MKFFFLLIIFLNINISANEELKVVYNSGVAPIKFKNINNQADGMIIDIWKLWAKKTNTKIKFIEASWDETLEMVKDGRADVHAGLYYTKQRDE